MLSKIYVKYFGGSTQQVIDLYYKVSKGSINGARVFAGPFSRLWYFLMGQATHQNMA